MSILTATSCAASPAAQEVGEPETEAGYTPKRHVFLGLRYEVTIRDQSGSPMTIYFDHRDQVMSFIYGFGAVLQKGQLVQVECDAIGAHAWIHGESPERRDRYGRRIMPSHGDSAFDALYKSLQLTSEASDEMKAWEEYTAHNPDWYIEKTKKRYAENRKREVL